MALIICPECGRQISDLAQTCPNCGAPVSSLPNNSNDFSPQSHVPPAIKPRRKVRAGIVVLIVIIVLLAVAGASVGGIMILRPHIVCSTARRMINDGNYLEAVKMLNSIKSSDEVESLLEIVDEKIEETVEDIMSTGDYEKALKKLNDYKSLSVYDKLYEKIKYESIALTCLLNLKPSMKNPNSLQANSIDFYTGDGDSAKYPIVIINESGQNGFGGYATSYSIYSASDLKLFGSCSSLDLDDYDSYDKDDIYEGIIAALISSYYEEDHLNVRFDLNRINRILSDNISPKINIEQFAEEPKSDDSDNQV